MVHIFALVIAAATQVSGTGYRIFAKNTETGARMVGACQNITKAEALRQAAKLNTNPTTFVYGYEECSLK